MKNIKNIAMVFFFILFLLTIVWRITQGLDPDFGWHLRMGQLILSKGIPMTDPFSYTMPSYPFIDHEWLTGVLIALLDPFISTIGLSVVFTLLAYLSLFLQFPLSFKKWASIPLLLCMGTISTYLGIRPQIISWVCFSLLLLILLHRKLWKIGQFFLPFLFLFWANLHGGFLAGIAVLGIFFLIRTWQEKKIIVRDWLLYIGCIGITFVNPYTYHLWGEVWVSLSDGSLHWSIQEWLPAFFFVNFYLLLFLPVSVVFIFYKRKQFSLLELCLYIVLLFFGLSSTRNIPFFLILAFPMTTRAIDYFARDIAKIPFGVQRFTIAYRLYLIIVIAVILFQIIPQLFAGNEKFTTSYYPNYAIDYLKKHPSSGNVFAPYAWGGYLIWKLPEKKVFIDGRMPSWRRVHAPMNESNDAFAESNAIISGSMDFAPVSKKYHIDTVLLMRYALAQENKKNLTSILSNIFHLRNENLPYFIQELKLMGMKEVYRDDISVIYRR